MSVIIRLQNLSWSANAADIRQYFQGLSIPEGGVHIVGGEKGDAFISFSTDEDARQAMLSDGGCIKDVQIRLLLSSRNEMQKVIESARQQTMQLTQVYMQQMQQPQLPIVVGSLPPLTAKVLPQPQQPQAVRPDRPVNLLRRQSQIILDPTAVQIISAQDNKPQHQLSPRSLAENNKDRDDKSGGSHKRERTRSKSRDRRSKSSRSGGGGGGSNGKRDRSRSRERRRRDRSRGRDRSRNRHRGRDSSSRGSASGGGRSHRSRSPTTANKDQQQQQQMQSISPWACQYDNNVQQQHQQLMMSTENHQQSAAMNARPPGSMYSQFRTPPQPPIVSGVGPSVYQQQQQKLSSNDWDSVVDDRHQPYVLENDFRMADVYDDGSDNEDDRRAEFEDNYRKRFNDNMSGSAMRRGPPGQNFREQATRGFGPNRGGGPLRFHRPPQSLGGHPNRGGGPRFNPTRYGGVLDGSGGGGGGRLSRFNSIQDEEDGNDGERLSRFNATVPPQHRDDSFVDDNNVMRLGTAPRYNDRYRYDVRNAQAPARMVGLCVEVNNMSNHFSYGDVRKLFDGIHMDGSAIKIQKHRQGVAFVRFDSNQDKNLALRLDGTAYKGNRVVVKHLDDEAYERENTDDRPYPTAPTIVDHVNLVDDDDENDNGAKSTAKKAAAAVTPAAAAGEAEASVKDKNECNDDNRSDNDRGNNKNRDDEGSNQLVACEKDTASATTTADDGGEQQQSSSTKEPSFTKYLKLKQLPITVTEENVLSEFDGGNDVRRVTFYPDGEFMGAALEFHSADAAEATLKRFDCVLLGSTPVPVLRCTNSEYAQIKRKASGGRRFPSDGNRHHHHHHHHHQQQRRPPPPASSSAAHSPPPGMHSSAVMPPPPGHHNHHLHNHHHQRSTNCLFIYGLPNTVTNTDITQFFADTSVLPDKIHIMLNKFGRPTGESYCEFGTAQQAHAALVKDQCYMGPNLVYVEPISRSEMIQTITKPMQQHNHQQDITSWGSGGMRGAGPLSRQQHMMSSSHRNHHHQGPQSSYGGGGHNNAGPYNGGRPQQQQQFMNNGGGYAPRMRGPGLGPNTGPDGFGQPGCVVALDNVPYRADVQEIVDFFDGFDLISQNVIRRFNDFGKPTGEARVNLRNPQEAMRAVRVLQNKPIYNRPVHLTLL